MSTTFLKILIYDCDPSRNALIQDSILRAAKEANIEVSCFGSREEGVLKHKSSSQWQGHWDITFCEATYDAQLKNSDKPWVCLGDARPSSSAPWNFSYQELAKTPSLLTPILKLTSQLSRAIDQASHERSYFLSMLNSLKDGVRIADPSGRIMFVNSAMEEIGGYTVDEMIGKRSIELFFKDDSAVQDQLKKYTRERLEGRTRTYEVTLTRKDGGKRLISVKAAPLRNSLGEITGSISINSDVSEKRELQKQLASTQKMEAIGQLAGGIAHDFNNLLTVITGYSELLLRRLGDSDTHRRELEIIDQAGRSGCALTQQLLALSKHSPVVPKVFDIAEPIREISKMLKGVLGSAVDFRLKLPELPLLVLADTSQIQQVIVNLALNARDAMRNEGFFEIAVSESSDGEQIVMRIVDGGCGMDNETLKRVFEPFFTTKSRHGMGLGMAMVNSTIKDMRGSISVESKVGQGTSIEIVLPKATSGQDALPKVIEDSEHSSQEIILFAEDEAAIRELVTVTLESYGYQVICFENGKTALEAIKDDNIAFDLLLSDVVMPELGGLELATEVLKIKPATPILLVSGYFEAKTIASGGKELSLPFIRKPFTPQALAKQVKEALQSKELIDEKSVANF